MYKKREKKGTVPFFSGSLDYSRVEVAVAARPYKRGVKSLILRNIVIKLANHQEEVNNFSRLKI